MDSREGKTPVTGDHQARALLNVADAATLRGQRDHAILATLLYKGLHRAELCALRVTDIQERRGVKHLQVRGKGSKICYVPLHPGAAGAIAAYLEAAGHGDDANRALSVQPPPTQMTALRQSLLMAFTRCSPATPSRCRST